MSRFADADGYDTDQNLWQQWLHLSITGKRGQKMLRELEAFLVAMPRKRLISGHIVKNGDMCTVGALAIAHGKTMEELEQRWGGDGHDDQDTVEVGKSVGATYTLAWHLGYMNDEEFACCSDEKRYEKVLEWVREQIKVAS